MFCSVIIPTIGRASVARTIYSVLDQDFTADTYEVIVVNDSGKPLPAANWQQSERVQVITTNQRERCVARNAGAAIAKGKYLCFLDDDDWLLPNALDHFWNLARQAGDAAWLYGGIQIVDETGTRLAEVNSGLNGNCFAQDHRPTNKIDLANFLHFSFVTMNSLEVSNSFAGLLFLHNLRLQGKKIMTHYGMAE